MARLEGDKESLILQVGPLSWETAYLVTSSSVRTLSGREAQEVFSVGSILFESVFKKTLPETKQKVTEATAQLELALGL